MITIHPIDYDNLKDEQLLEEARDILFSSLGCPLLQEQQIYVSTADIRDTITSWKSLPPPLKKIKVKSEFYNVLVKACPPITLSEAEAKGVRGLFTGVPIEIDDEIEDDYEPVYGEENAK